MPTLLQLVRSYLTSSSLISHTVSYVAIILVAATVATQFLPPAPPALAYTLEGCKWSSSSIYYIPPSDSYNSAAGDATGNWNNARTHVFLYSSSTQGISIFDQDDGAVDYVGLTTWNCNSGIFSNVKSHWNSYWTNNYDYGGKVAVMVHELGHAMGLGHNGSLPCPVPIMDPNIGDSYTTCGETTPQSDDINGINSLY